MTQKVATAEGKDLHRGINEWMIVQEGKMPQPNALIIQDTTIFDTPLSWQMIRKCFGIEPMDFAKEVA